MSESDWTVEGHMLKEKQLEVDSIVGLVKGLEARSHIYDGARGRNLPIIFASDPNNPIHNMSLPYNEFPFEPDAKQYLANEGIKIGSEQYILITHTPLGMRNIGEERHPLPEQYTITKVDLRKKRKFMTSLQIIVDKRGEPNDKVMITKSNRNVRNTKEATTSDTIGFRMALERAMR